MDVDVAREVVVSVADGKVTTIQLIGYPLEDVARHLPAILGGMEPGLVALAEEEPPESVHDAWLATPCRCSHALGSHQAFESVDGRRPCRVIGCTCEDWQPARFPE